MRPKLIVFDVNETLSDMEPIAERFKEVGASRELARTWFAALLRDGFALTATGEKPVFATLAADALRVEFSRAYLNRPIEDAIAYVMEGFATLATHNDVAPGVTLLAEAGFRIVTLSNGSSEVARALLSRSGVIHHFEALLSVDDAPSWKPGAASYEHALKDLAVAPDDAMLVAVHPWDLDGAAKVGMSTAWVNRPGGHFPSYFRPPSIEARTIVDLANQLS